MPPGLRVTPRDLALMRALFESRVLKLAHAAIFSFAGSGHAAQQRIYKLKAAGILAEKRRHPSNPSLLFLTRAGIELLRVHGILAEYPPLAPVALEKRTAVSPLTLAHELAVLDCKAALTARLAGSDTLRLQHFQTWPALFQFRVSSSSISSPVLVQPDASLKLTNTTRGHPLPHFFLELDRSTEATSIPIRRAQLYRSFYQAGGFAARCGFSPLDSKRAPFVVLILCRTAERRNNLAVHLLKLEPPILRQVWLTMTADFLADPLGPIWMRPADYEAATRGTTYHHTEQPDHSRRYVRQIAREAFVDAHATKFSLTIKDEKQVVTAILPTVQPVGAVQ